jgi:MFS family permease
MSTSNRRSWLILCICCMSLLIVGTDVTIVNVALPAIRQDLHASLSGLQWSVDAYTLVLGSLLMASGSTADRFGRRRVFQTGLALFTLGSLLSSLAPSVAALIIFRCVQALGGSMLNPVALSPCRSSATPSPSGGRGPGRWASGPRSSASAWRSAPWWAACSSRP